MPYLHQFYFTLHQVKTMFEYACEKCEKSFVSGSKLNQHNNQLHEEVKCDECGKMFKKGNFARHRKVHADSNSVLTCQICAKTFSRMDNLHAHATKCPEENLVDVLDVSFYSKKSELKMLKYLFGALSSPRLLISN